MICLLLAFALTCFLSNFASSKESFLPATEYVKCYMILLDRLTEFENGSSVGVLIDPEKLK